MTVTLQTTTKNCLIQIASFYPHTGSANKASQKMKKSDGSHGQIYSWKDGELVTVAEKLKQNVSAKAQHLRRYKARSQQYH